MIQIACATLCAEGFEYHGFERTVQLVPAAGYQWLEVNYWHAPAIVPEAVASFAAKCKNADLKVAAVYGSGVGGFPGREDVDIAHKLRLLDIAEQLGAQRIVFGGSPRSGSGSLESAITVLSILAPIAAQRDMLICLENHCNFTIETPDDYSEIFSHVSQRNVGICIDTGHFDASNVDMMKLIDNFRARIVHLHVKENLGKGSVAFRRFGEGTTDNVAVIERLIADDYSGFITVEISPPKDRPNEVADLRKPLEMFGKYCTSAT